MSNINLQKKLSVAKVFGKVNAAVIAKAADGVLNIMRVMGSAIGIKDGVSDYGEWTSLVGQFRAVNLQTGETYDSANLFLPDVAGELIIAQLKGGATAVDFAFDISAVLDETSQIGYTYRATPLVAAEEESPITRLEKKLAHLALPAPAEEKPKNGKK